MTNSEFSNEFDVLFDSMTSGKAPGLDEYEKSVLLTKAQYEIQYAYANPKGNKFIEGIDGSKKRQADFSNLLVSKKLKKINVPDKFDSRSICFGAPVDMFIPLNEKCTDKNGRYIVTPITYDEYDIYMSKPYQYPVKRHVWRLFTQTRFSLKSDVSGMRATGADSSISGDISQIDGDKTVIIELIGRVDEETLKYSMRYLRRARPIILEDLPDGLSIDGESKKSECELDPEIHREILTRAVELGKAMIEGSLNSLIAVGSSSATNLGIVPQSNERQR